MNEITDYFGLYGYRAMALAMIEQALVDLVQTRDPRLSRSAKEWIEFDPPKDAVKQGGLTFGDCIEAAGASSACEVFRQRSRTEPAALRDDLHRMSVSLQCERRHVRNAASDDVNADPTFALDTRALPSTHVFHANEMASHAAQAYPS